MRYLNLLALAAILCVGCQQETISEPDNAAISAQLVSTANEYTPIKAFDTSVNGVYHGVIVAAEGTNRGKIWVNLNNNNTYTAKVLMHSGKTIQYDGSLIADNTDEQVRFTSKASSFLVDFTQNGTVFSQAEIGGEPYFIHAPKQTTMRMTFPFTGDYTFDDNGAAGTWTIFMDASSPDPNGVGFGGFAMADVVVTYGANMFTDNSHESGFYPCEGANGWVPVIRIQEFGGGTIFINEMFVLDQDSMFGGATNWQIFFAGGIQYFDETCDNLTSGIFDWTNPNTGMNRTGKIYLDQDF